MNGITQHIPNFAYNGEEKPYYEFDTLNDLLNLDMVQKYTKSNNHDHFEMSDEYLMSVSEKCDWWWCIGKVDHPDLVNLPQLDTSNYKGTNK